MSETLEDGPLDPHAALRNILAQLQQDPIRYRLFGIWWWPVKALLRGAGYGPDQLYLLGGYMDPEQAAMVPEQDLRGTLRSALAEFGQNARFPRAGGEVETPDGELVRIVDPDAGGI